MIELYRMALANNRDNVPALSGLADVGDASDLPLLRTALASPIAAIRSSGIRGIGRIGTDRDAIPISQFLTDTSPNVVREARKAVEPHVAELGPACLFGMLSPDAPEHSKRNILRMLFDVGRWRGLPFLIRAAASDDEASDQLGDPVILMRLARVD